MLAERPDQAGGTFRPWMAAVLFVVTTVTFTGWPLVTGSAMGGTDILQYAAPYESDIVEITTGVNPIQTDLLEHMPMVIEVWQGVQEGRFQLWEPDVGAGVPLGSVAYTRTLAPWFLPGAFLPLPLITTVAVAIGLLLAQFGTYGLARRLGLRVGGAALAAVSWTFSAPVVLNLLRIQDLFLFPLLLYAIHGGVTAAGRRGRYLALAGIVSASTWAAGFPSVDLYMLYVGIAFAAYLAVTRTSRFDRWPERLREAGRSAAPAIAAVGLGIGLMAFQLLPTREFLEHSGALDRTFGTDYTAGIAMLADAVSGRFFGAFQDSDWWWPDPGFSNPVEAGSTVGLVVIGLLASLLGGLGRSVPTAPRVDRDLGRFFLPTGLVVLVAVYLGGPVLWAVYQLPLMDTSPFGRSRFILALGICLAAGYALDRLLSGGPERAPSRLLRLEVAAVLGAIAVGLGAAAMEAERLNQLREIGVDMLVPVVALVVAAACIWLATRSRSRRMVGAAGVLVTLMVAFELQWGAWGFVGWSGHELSYPDHGAFDAIEGDVGPGGQYRFVAPDLSVLPPNVAASLDLSDVRVHFPSSGGVGDLLLALGGVDRTGKRLKFRLPHDLDVNAPILDRLAVRYVVDPLSAPPRRTGPASAAVTVGGPQLPVVVGTGDVPETVRALEVEFAHPDRDCTAGWVEVRHGQEVIARRLLRELSGPRTFVLRDLPGTELAGGLTVEATHCPVRLGSDRVRFVAPADGSTLDVVSNDGWIVYGRDGVRPRTTLARRVMVAGRRPDRQASAQPADVTIVDGWGGPRHLGGGQTRLIDDGPDRVLVEARSDGPGLLVLADAAAPGWQARVDGETQEILRIDHAFRGVKVPDGSSRVEFRYRPASFRRGLTMSAIAAVFLVLLCATGDRIAGFNRGDADGVARGRSRRRARAG